LPFSRRFSPRKGSVFPLGPAPFTFFSKPFFFFGFSRFFFFCDTIFLPERFFPSTFSPRKASRSPLWPPDPFFFPAGISPFREPVLFSLQSPLRSRNIPYGFPPFPSPFLTRQLLLFEDFFSPIFPLNSSRKPDRFFFQIGYRATSPFKSLPFFAPRRVWDDLSRLLLPPLSLGLPSLTLPQLLEYTRSFPLVFFSQPQSIPDHFPPCL